MPRDSTLLPEWSQQLLRAARAGRLFEHPTSASDCTGEKSEAKRNGDAEHELHSNDQHCVTIRKWTRAPRHLEEPEQDYLAKRRKGLPSLRNGIAGYLGFGSAMRKTKIRKVDSEGNANVWQVLVPEGQSVEGEITNEEESVLAVPKATIPGTVIEGVGAVNSDGLVVVNDRLISTPPRRRPPPPRRKPKKGPGRGRKKVIFKPGEEGAEAKPNVVASGVQEAAAVDTLSTSGAAQGQDKDVTMVDMPEVDDNEEEGEEDEDEGEIEEGEDDEDDREEGEISPSSPGPSDIQAPAGDESQSRRESVSITEAYPKPVLHPLPAAPSSTSGLPPKPVSLESSVTFPQHSQQQQQQAPGQAGSAASPSTLTETKSSRAQAISRDRDLQESVTPISLVPQHLFGTTIPPAPKPQHSSSLLTKPLKSPLVSDTLTESRSAFAAVSDISNTNEAASKTSVPPLGNIVSQDPRIISSSPDLPLVEAFSHNRENPQNIGFPSRKQGDSFRQVDEMQQVPEKSKEVDMTGDSFIIQTTVQNNVNGLHEQVPGPMSVEHSESNVESESSAVKPKAIDQMNSPSISAPETNAPVATTGVAAAEGREIMNEIQNQASDAEPRDNIKHNSKAAVPHSNLDNSQATLLSNNISSTPKPPLDSFQPVQPERRMTSSTSQIEAPANSTAHKTDSESENEHAKEKENQEETVQKSPLPQEAEQQREQEINPKREDKDSLKRDQNQNQSQNHQKQAHDQENAHASADAGTTGTGIITNAIGEKSAAEKVDTIVTTDVSAATGGDRNISTNGSGDGSDIDLLGTLERRLDAKEEEE